MNLKFEQRIIPFRYPGGKFYALNQLAPYILGCGHDEYREPFVGGGSVFFSKPKAKYNIVNDIDSELITTYRIMQDPVLRDKLVEMLSKEVASKERWKEVFMFQPQTPLEVAFKYYYLNRTSFSGKLSSPAWGYREKRSLPPSRWHERIIPCGEKLSNTLIENSDFEDIIRREPLGKNVLMFIDPPYFKPSKNKHYRHGFELEDHIRLAKCLRESEFNFVLTYEDVNEVRELYSWAFINGLEFAYRVDDSSTNNGNRRKGTELIITNFKQPQLNLFST